MKERIENWYAIQEVIGLSCSFVSGGLVYSLCRLKRTANDIHIEDRKTFAQQEEMIRYLKAHQALPIALHIQGKGVLIKAMPLTPELSNEHIRSVFPNYQEEEYGYSYFPGKSQAWLALLKLDMLEDLLAVFRAEKLAVLRVFAGPFVVDNILDQLNGYSGHFSFDGHHISQSTEDKRWESYRYSAEEKAKFSIKVQGMDLAEHTVLAYAAAFSLLMHRFVEDRQLVYPAVDQQLEDFLQGIKFKVNGIALLAILFFLLLLNTVLYTVYQGKYDRLHSQTQANFSNVSELQKLSNAVNSNDSLLLALGWNGGLQKSWLFNQLASSLQGYTGIDWQSVAINPLLTKRFGAAFNETDNRYQIQLAGSCRTLNELEAWVRNLSHLYWLRTVEISKFIDQNKPNSSRKDFVINMQYRYDF